MFTRALTVFALVATFWVGSAVQATTIDFESETVGTYWGTPVGDIVGDVVLTAGNVDVSVENLFAYGTYHYNEAEIIDSAYFGSHAAMLLNISLEFDMTQMADARQLTLDFHDNGGMENVWVNANGLTPVSVSNLGMAGTDIAPGVTLSVTQTSVGTGVYAGSLVLTATDPAVSLETFRIGGQELQVDNIVITPEPGALALLALGAMAAVRRKTN